MINKHQTDNRNNKNNENHYQEIEIEEGNHDLFTERYNVGLNSGQTTQRTHKSGGEAKNSNHQQSKRKFGDYETQTHEVLSIYADIYDILIKYFHLPDRFEAEDKEVYISYFLNNFLESNKNKNRCQVLSKKHWKCKKLEISKK